MIRRIKSLCSQRLIWLVGVLVLLGMIVNGIMGKGGYLELRLIEERNKALKSNIDALKQENQQLLDEIEQLKTNPNKIIEEARDRYNMVGKGEIKITTTPPTCASSATAIEIACATGSGTSSNDNRRNNP
jgi:cell division protein FtsB